MKVKHKGASSELVASQWLLSQGYDVFRNVSSHGIADLVAVDFDTKEIIYIDVKTVTSRPDGKPGYAIPKPQKQHKENNVKLLYVNETHVVGWCYNQ